MMQFNLKSKYRYYALIFMVLIFSGFQAKSTQTQDIVLQDEPLPVTPKEFYITNVLDERDDRTPVAWLLPAVLSKNNKSKTFQVDLKGGAVAAIKQFIDHNVPVDKSFHPLILGLKKFTVNELLTADGRVEGHVSLIMSFSLDRGEEDVLHLADYKGSAVYTRSAGPASDIEPTLRHLLINGLVYINTWMNQQAATNIKLAKGVKVSFTDYKGSPEGDTIYYSVNRPLTWNDFQSKTGSTRYEAQVFPGIGYDEVTKVNNGIINIRMSIKVSLPKSACWVKQGSQSAYALNHEQRHFDIVKIIAEQFKEKIKAENLQVNNFDGSINVDYLETYREMDSMQKLYDDETMHGINQAAQQRWNERIDKELKKYGVK